jgi:DNA primase
VNVALLPPGDDPDGFIRTHGVAAYLDLVKASRPYVEYLLDRAAQGRDFGSDEVRRDFLNRMLPIAAQIPDAAGRDQFADRLAHKARVTEDVVRAEIRKAAVERKTTLTAKELPSFGQIRPAERGLIWAVFHDEDGARAALGRLGADDFEMLLTRRVLEIAQGLYESGTEDVPSALLARLNSDEARLVTGIAAVAERPVPAAESANELRLMRFERERAGLQREIERLQAGGAGLGEQLEELLQTKVELSREIDRLRMA